MSLFLTPGQEINLTEENPELGNIFVGIGWDVNSDKEDEDFDLDASAFMVSVTGKVEQITDVIFYSNLKHPSGAVVHTGDNRTGKGEGDDEAILVDLSNIPASIGKIAFTVSIYEGEKRGQTFGQISNAYIRIFDEVDGKEVFRYNLGEDFSVETAVIFGEIYKDGGDWKFNAIGKGMQGGILALCEYYGVGRK